IVEADGGSRGNPGPAGYGAVVLDATNRDVLAERKGGLGIATNNVAEYTGLIDGLRAAAELGADRVDVRMDSKLVVEQMSGRWKIKHPGLRPLALQARDAATRFSRVRYQWIPRAQNSHADRLANEAMDAQAADGQAAGEKDDPDPGTIPGLEVGAAQRPAPAQWTGAQGTPTRLFLLRHGQTAMSVDRRYSGRADVPLTDAGYAQAAAAAKRFAGMDPARLHPGGGPAGAGVPVVSSPLGRARATAEQVADALGSSVDEHPGLLETDFGQWEGLTFAEAAARDPELHTSWLSDTAVPAPGGESFDVVHGRVRRARDELLARHGGRSVVVVSHVTPIKCLLRMGLSVGPQLLFRLHLDLASLSIVEFYPDGHASVRLVNDTSHLE
ncbi:MAG: bifunctional RNase H/acid phosphatase, partial [Thermocrispum sp.]